MNNTPSYPEASGSGRHRPAGVTARRLLPLTVWLCSDSTGTNTRKENDSENQRAKHNAVCARHRQMVGYELARHLITSCTREGDLVADAYTTSEATLLVCGLRDGGLVNRASFFQMLEARRAREKGIPACATTHEDLLIFQRARDLTGRSR
jgi:hypothetical protein